MASTHIHIPTPGDHYSPATGSAVMTVVYELARCHASNGGQSQIIVAPGTRHDYPVGETSEAPFGAPVSRNQKLIDALAGRSGMRRPFISKLYSAATHVIPADTRATIFLHNAPGALRIFRKHFPSAQICLYAHNQLFNTYSRSEIRKTVVAADRIICVSQFIANDLIARLGSGSEKIRAVPNGVDVSRFKPAPLQNNGIPVILFLGRVLPEKGPDLLIQAAVKIFSDKRQFRVRIVGSSNFNAADPLTPYESHLRDLAKPIKDFVDFQPFVDRSAVLNEYHRATIFCVPSNWDEPVSLTISEGLACGLPTIASRRGGIPEVAGDAVLYFNPPNVDELATHLARLIDDSNLRSELAHRARAQAEAISWSHQYDKLQHALN